MKLKYDLYTLLLRTATIVALLIIGYQLASISGHLSRIEVVLTTREFVDINHINIPSAPAVSTDTVIPVSTAPAEPSQPVTESVSTPAAPEMNAEETAVQSIEKYMQEPAKVDYPDAKEHVVEMLNYGSSGAMVYQPAAIKINTGDSIRFKPTSYGHNAQSIEDIISSDAGMPKGAKPWRGEMNEEFSVQFTVPGIYLYACTYHYIVGHVGVIMVGDDKHNMPDIKQAAALLKSKMLSNADRVDKYLAQLD